MVLSLLGIAVTAGGSYFLFKTLLGGPPPARAVADVARPQKEIPQEQVKQQPPETRSNEVPPPVPVQPPPPKPEPVGPGVGKLNPDSSIQKDSNWFVCFPANGQQEVPRIFPGNEVPDPLPQTNDKLAGYPVTVTFARQHNVRQAQAEFLDEQRQAVPVWFSSPEQPANPRHSIEQSNTICLIAHGPLRPGCTYTVSASAQVDGRPWKHRWSFTTRSEADERRQIEQQALDRINYYRKLARLEPVKLDPNRSAACMAHARYLTLNLPSHPDINWNDEDPKLPGASTEGKAASPGSAIFLGGGPVGLIDWMVGSFLNRHALLEPNLHAIGLGFALYPGRGHAWVLYARTERPVGAVKDVLVFPVDGQKDVPLAYHMRSQPLPYPASYKDKEVGYALTARLPGGEMPANITARLTDGSSKDIPVWLSTGDQPAVPKSHQSWIGLIPQAPLREGTSYAVLLQGQRSGQPWQTSWNFTTMSLAEEGRARIAGRLLKTLNRQRRLAGLGPVELDVELSRGCELHCQYIVRHFLDSSTQGLGQHDESPSLEGYTPEGRKAGRASVIANDANPEEAVDNWLSTLYHRVSLLHPSLKRVGFGIARLPDQNYMTMLDAGSDVRGR
jgi:uncharacterized protein YkwD